MAVRKVVTRSGRRVRGYFPSRKMGRMVAWESQLERDALYLFEFSTGVLTYREQPERVHFPMGEEVRLYIPDFELVLEPDELCHVEVKPASKLVKPDVAQRFQAIVQHYDRIGRRFQILTEINIRHDRLLSNLKLLAYHSGRLDAAALQGFVDNLLIKPARTFKDVAAALGCDANAYRLLASGKYCCDLSRAIGPDTVIAPAQESCHATLLF